MDQFSCMDIWDVFSPHKKGALGRADDVPVSARQRAAAVLLVVHDASVGRGRRCRGLRRSRRQSLYNKTRLPTNAVHCRCQ